MRKAILAGALGLMMVGGLFMAQGANAYGGDNCSGANVAGPVYGPAGNEVVCVDNAGLPGFEGGALLAGSGGPGRLCAAGTQVASAPAGVYVVADGNNANTANLSGYAGISTAETGSTEGCAQQNNGSGSNSGGSFGLKAVPGATLPLPFACGFTTGPNFETTSRDGCYIP